MFFRKAIYILALIWTHLIGLQGLSAQDPIFSQFYAAPLQMNPAFAGLSEGPRLGIIYRNQWPFVDQSFKTYVTYNLAYDQYFTKLKSGFGLELTADDAGDGLIKTIKVAGMYGYKIQLNSDGHVIKGGLELGFVQVNYGWDKFIFGDQIDPATGYLSPGGLPILSKESRPLETNKSYFDAGVGLLYYSPDYYLGISAKHFNSPDIGILQVNQNGFGGLPVRWGVHGGFSFRLDRNSRGTSGLLSPGIQIVTQSSFFQLNMGTQYQFSTVFAGLWYRHARQNADAMIGVIGFRKDSWKLAYSFDYTLSKLGIGLGGSHEISILFNKMPEKRKKKNIQDCFEAFN
ncbi:MAG: PorP/SprF family type IX secretion system membrane protein [Saprospiraceae bacterium]|nr:PorP/SprF family type IX secretion system membrane protein [Candidatus Vicinibacter affinis]MBP6172162.1 PorP/SprF family type IX secretion system membrane protein [Saprospiraceae bacterium]MBK6822860.1 PorP/SprF family type IX secretion system membrane protein [Candidatus Vicinibacter affinis]MBK7304958.1 PorP/SprF family type IX secretion system membrane protein [Candidatus Vicinibacter affinis]MBK7694723.1 PorP/SprF family type IX secretion system membrane protein [Candidatus Vicinibacter